jgi:hypothetical protein
MKHIFAISMAMFAASVLDAAEFETAVIRLANDSKTALTARRGKALEVSAKKATEFRIVPGLTNPSFVSIQLKGSDRFYVRHQNFVLHLQEYQKGSPLFEADATFKLLSSADGTVRFEASNFPGKFITVNASGTVAVMANSPIGQSTFTITK